MLWIVVGINKRKVGLPALKNLKDLKPLEKYRVRIYFSLPGKSQDYNPVPRELCNTYEESWSWGVRKDMTEGTRESKRRGKPSWMYWNMQGKRDIYPVLWLTYSPLFMFCGRFSNRFFSFCYTFVDFVDINKGLQGSS